MANLISWLWPVVVVWICSLNYVIAEEICVKPCKCDRKNSLVCSREGLMEVPKNIPKWVERLNLGNNQISFLGNGSFENLTSLVDLKLNRNHIHGFGKGVFKNLNALKSLELNKNNLTEIKGLTFTGLDSLEVLAMKRNSISALLDGAFFTLKSMTELQLDHNEIKNVTKGWLYGLSSLSILSLSHNRIVYIEPSAWDSCQSLSKLVLSYNRLHKIDKGIFDYLSKLTSLSLNYNRIDYIHEGAFNSTSSLKNLELDGNSVSSTIEDMHGAFIGLTQLVSFSLASNKIQSINKNAFLGLGNLKKLNLRNNSITSVQENAFSGMGSLMELYFNTSSLLCDCNLAWFPKWLAETTFTVHAVCGHPHHLNGHSVMEVPESNFTCDGFPKPRIIEEPGEKLALKGDNVSLRCEASSSSSLPMTIQWKKDNVDLKNPNVNHFVRSYNGEARGEISELKLLNISHNEAGKYQCVVSNQFGTTYSSKSNISVLIYPTFTKTPSNVTLKTGNTARLECAAAGQPSPQIAWQKDGGNDFPAARERRMHVMPTDDVFFIINVKTSDMGVYSCTAQNPAGTIVANASLNVLETPYFVKPMESKEVRAGETIVLECMASGSPKPRLRWKKDGSNLVPTERHFFTADDQLLIIVGTTTSDAGMYECEMSNPLGTERGYSFLTIIPASGILPSDDSIAGIVVIAVVCCAVATSVVWVVIIYQARKRAIDNGGGDAANDGRGEVGPPSAQRTLATAPTIVTAGDPVPTLPVNYMDTDSEHSSSKDSGTGDSAKRSSDDLLPATQQSEDSPHHHLLSMPDGESIMSADVNVANGKGFLVDPQSSSPSPSKVVPTLCTFHPQPTNHERCKSLSSAVPSSMGPAYHTLPRWGTTPGKEVSSGSSPSLVVLDSVKESLLARGKVSGSSLWPSVTEEPWKCGKGRGEVEDELTPCIPRGPSFSLPGGSDGRID
ncbi:leucine-rich repeats and immunoglobulin-like domains protein 3 [Ischnura elegans]|uniref:leucine-rich repeats and immunoglobulin-like domains protein 3 n=1 Tax=Ischnura elegans TaxID=197161 RepID=UPI001ED86A7B|nr:leucine-rich repeats and immunoglobulin-like domains protein 3 [Ischnura elegans]